VRWKTSQRCLHGPPTFTRWHVAGAGGRTACGYLVPVAVPVEATEVTPRWRLICLRCRRDHDDGVTGQLWLPMTTKEAGR
jgi:hypothetical protein